MSKIKTISIVTNSRENTRVTQNIKNDLRKVFQEAVAIKNYYLDELSLGDIIIGDAILVMLERKLVEIKNYVKSTDNVIVVERTLLEKATYDILSIPRGTKVLVVNDCYETSLQTVSTIYQLGIDHLHLIPYNEDEKQDTSIKIAITPGERESVPEFIENILDIGQRCLDIYTIMKIINILKIEDKNIAKNIAKNLIKYSSTILDTNRGLNQQYKDSFIKNELLEITLEKFNSGILILDNKYNIIYANLKTRQLLNLKENSSGEITDYIDEELFKKLVKLNSKQELLVINNETLMVSKNDLYFFGEIGAYYFNFNSISNIKNLNQELTNNLIQKGFIAKYTFDDIIYSSDSSMRRTISIAKKVSTTDYTIMIYGESGTGKEILAQAIHNFSSRKDKPFVAINCAAFPESLLESELFGYEKGSFTGANKTGKLGLFELANSGTIFLDEIGDMALPLQSRLLRVLQEKQIMKIGSDRITNIDVRIIAATNRDLLQLIEEGKFRHDLYYRLNILSLTLPSLRERKEDILLLFRKFIGEDEKYLDSNMEKAIIEYKWLGNIRELINCSYYFKLMKTLPESILKTQHSININWNLEVLKEILYLNENDENASRNKILDRFLKRDLYISEKNLREILKYLKEVKYIEVNRGRKGTLITKSGIDFLNK